MSIITQLEALEVLETTISGFQGDQGNIIFTLLTGSADILLKLEQERI